MIGLGLRCTAALILSTLAVTAAAQSAPALQIAPEHRDPSSTRVEGGSAPALRIAPAHRDNADTIVIPQASVPALRRGRAHPESYRPDDTVVYAGRSGSYQRTCESVGHARSYCDVPAGRVRLLEQHSRSSCREGRDWGVGRYAVWVDNGCRATFGVD